MMEIKRKVIEAAYRLLDTEHNCYPDLVLTGSEESAKKFHDDVTLVAEFVGEIVLHVVEHGA